MLTGYEAARWVLDKKPDTFTAVLGPGFAPTGQRAELAGAKPGPWTDTYGLAAIAYFAITGKSPPPAVDRLVDDVYVPLANLAASSYSPRFLQAIDNALAGQPEDRTLNLAAFRRQLGLNNPVAEPLASPSLSPAPYPSAPARMSAQAQPLPSPSAAEPMRARSSGGGVTARLVGALAAAGG